MVGTDVNTPEQKAGISLNKTQVCCKLKNVVKLRFYSASLASLFKMMLRFAST